MFILLKQQTRKKTLAKRQKLLPSIYKLLNFSLAILANAPAQAETLLHSLERADAGIGLHVNAHKTEYMCFNQTGNIFILGGSSLKLVTSLTI